MSKTIIKSKEQNIVVEVNQLTTVTEFISLQKEAGRKPCTKPGIYYAMKAKSLKFITIAGKPFIFKDQKSQTKLLTCNCL